MLKFRPNMCFLGHICNFSLVSVTCALTSVTTSLCDQTRLTLGKLAPMGPSCEGYTVGQLSTTTVDYYQPGIVTCNWCRESDQFRTQGCRRLFRPPYHFLRQESPLSAPTHCLPLIEILDNEPSRKWDLLFNQSINYILLNLMKGWAYNGKWVIEISAL